MVLIHISIIVQELNSGKDRVSFTRQPIGLEMAVLFDSYYSSFFMHFSVKSTTSRAWLQKQRTSSEKFRIGGQCSHYCYTRV